METANETHAVIQEKEDSIEINDKDEDISVYQPIPSKLPLFLKLQIFYANINCLIALFIFMLCLFFAFVSGLYAFGQVLDLQLANYWCDLKDLDTIHAHSIANNLNHGTNDGCWTSKQWSV